MSSEFIRQKTFARGSLTPTERSRLAERDISSPADPLSRPKIRSLPWRPGSFLFNQRLGHGVQSGSSRLTRIVPGEDGAPWRFPHAIAGDSRKGTPSRSAQRGMGLLVGAALQDQPQRGTCDYEEVVVRVRLIGHRLRARLYDDRLDVFVGRAARHDRVGADHRRPRCRPVHQLLRSYSFRAAAHIVPRSRTFDVVERRRISLLLHPAVAL